MTIVFVFAFIVHRSLLCMDTRDEVVIHCCVQCASEYVGATV